MSTALSKRHDHREMSFSNVQHLDTLAAEIRKSYSNTQLLYRTTEEKMRQTLEEALICGTALIEVKRIVGHGKFLSWLSDKVSELSYRQAVKYMRLARSNMTGRSYLDFNASMEQNLRRINKLNAPAALEVEADQLPQLANGALSQNQMELITKKAETLVGVLRDLLSRDAITKDEAISFVEWLIAKCKESFS